MPGVKLNDEGVDPRLAVCPLLIVLLTGCAFSVAPSAHRKLEISQVLKNGLTTKELVTNIGWPSKKYTPDTLKETEFDDLSLSSVYKKINRDVTEIWIYNYKEKYWAFKTRGLVFVFISQDKKILDWEFVRTEFERGVLLEESQNR